MEESRVQNYCLLVVALILISSNCFAQIVTTPNGSFVLYEYRPEGLTDYCKASIHQHILSTYPTSSILD